MIYDKDRTEGGREKLDLLVCLSQFRNDIFVQSYFYLEEIMSKVKMANRQNYCNK